MPKTTLAKNTQDIDWMLAIVLERMYVTKMTRGQLADKTHYGYGYIRNRFREHVYDWPSDFRKAVFKALGISVEKLPKDVRLLIGSSLIQN